MRTDGESRLQGSTGHTLFALKNISDGLIAIWVEPVRGVILYSVVEKAGRMSAKHGNQAVDTLFYNAHDYSDRYSERDTIREQGNIYLTTDTKLLSTSSSTLMTIIADTCGRHDTLDGACANESNMVRYVIEKRFMHACRNSFLKGALEWGRGREKRDPTPIQVLIWDRA